MLSSSQVPTQGMKEQKDVESVTSFGDGESTSNSESELNQKLPESSKIRAEHFASKYFKKIWDGHRVKNGEKSIPWYESKHNEILEKMNNLVAKERMKSMFNRVGNKVAHILTDTKLGIWNKVATEEEMKPEGELPPSGAEGMIVHADGYEPNKVLKVMLDHQKFQHPENLKCIKALEGKDLGENFMKVFKVVNDKNVIYEYIKGKSYSDTIVGFERKPIGVGAKLDLDFFIDKWLIGTLEGMKKIHKITGKYLVDRHVGNYIVKNYGTPKAILVQVDYDFSGEAPLLNPLLNVFQTVMQLNITDPDPRFQLLYLLISFMYGQTCEDKNIDFMLNAINDIKLGRLSAN